MFVLNTVKSVVSFAVSVGSGATVKMLVTSVTPDTVKPFTKLALKASSVVIGVAVADLTGRYIEDQIDHAVELGQALNKGWKRGVETAMANAENNDNKPDENVKGDD